MQVGTAVKTLIKWAFTRSKEAAMQLDTTETSNITPGVVPNPKPLPPNFVPPRPQSAPSNEEGAVDIIEHDTSLPLVNKREWWLLFTSKVLTTFISVKFWFLSITMWFVIRIYWLGTYTDINQFLRDKTITPEVYQKILATLSSDIKTIILALISVVLIREGFKVANIYLERKSGNNKAARIIASPNVPSPQDN